MGAIASGGVVVLNDDAAARTHGRGGAGCPRAVVPGAERAGGRGGLRDHPVAVRGGRAFVLGFHPDDRRGGPGPAPCRVDRPTTYTGTVTAASDWEDPAERKLVRPALPGSVEELFHEVGEKAFWVPFGSAPRAAGAHRRVGPGRGSGDLPIHRLNHGSGIAHNPTRDVHPGYDRRSLVRRAGS
jgi:Erythromycin esterase